MNRELTADLLSIRTAALQAVDPEQAVRRYLRAEPEGAIQAGKATWDTAVAGRLYLVAVGKAAAPMSKAAVEALGERIQGGIVVTKYGHAAGCSFPPQIRVFESGHPVPDAAGLAAAQTVSDLVAGLPAGSALLVLLSGGASALLPLPEPGLTLEELQSLTGLLLRSGATIQEINALRKHLDRLKGGKLVRLAAPRPTAALILSDVVGDPLDVIASGPTVADPTTFADCWQILERFGLGEAIPGSIATYLREGLAGRRAETPKPGDPLFAAVVNTIVGSNHLAAEAASAEAARLGYQPLVLSTFVEGEAREAGRLAAALVKGVRYESAPLSPPACLIWGGETTVTIHGQGIGGRNQELALSTALSIEGVADAAVMALATDGSDGPTEAAGAIVDGETAARARRLGFDPRRHLSENDSYHLLKSVGALMVTGPTGTNVNDLLVALVK
ncbi:MAG TPA: glycerate kinase [Anaerolineaceae bacterium]|nr:glycerate kinase [Anaerolineaceae bacterium]